MDLKRDVVIICFVPVLFGILRVNYGGPASMTALQIGSIVLALALGAGVLALANRDRAP